jgi:hypothetical protein
MDFTIQHCSGASSGVPFLVTATSSGTAHTVDTAVSGTTNFDCYAITLENLTDADVVASVIWGATTISYTVPAYGSRTVRARLNGATVTKIYAAVASAIACHPTKELATP